MLRNLFTIVPTLLALMAPNILAQQWSANLPREPAKELTFQDYKQAFEDYYKEHPVPLDKEKLKPTFSFAGTAEMTDRMIEATNRFARSV